MKVLNIRINVFSFKYITADPDLKYVYSEKRF